MTGQCRGGWLEGTGASAGNPIGAGNLTCLLCVAGTQNKDSQTGQSDILWVYGVIYPLPIPSSTSQGTALAVRQRSEAAGTWSSHTTLHQCFYLLWYRYGILDGGLAKKGAGETVFSYSKLAPWSVCLNQWSEPFWWVTVIIFHCLEWIKFSQDKSVLWSSQASPSASLSSRLPAVLSVEQHWGQMWSQTVRELQDPRASYCSQVRSLASFTLALRWGSVLCFGIVGGFCLFLVYWVEKNIINCRARYCRIGMQSPGQRKCPFLGGQWGAPCAPSCITGSCALHPVRTAEGAWAFRIGCLHKEKTCTTLSIQQFFLAARDIQFLFLHPLLPCF